MAVAGPSTSLLNRILTANDQNIPREARANLTKELLVQLSSEAYQVRADGRDIAATLFGDAFPLFDFLLPLLTAEEIRQERTMNLSDHARSCLTLVASVCSPKEVVMAIEQKLAELRTVESVDYGDEEPQSGGPGSLRDATFTLACLIPLYASALTRIKTKRPLQFLSPALTSILDNLTTLRQERAFLASEPAQATSLAAVEGDPLAEEAFKAVLDFARHVGSWVAASAGDEWEAQHTAVSLLHRFLHSALAQLHMFVPSAIALEYFHRRYPVYRRSASSQELTGGQRVWEQAESVFHILRVDLVATFPVVVSSEETPLARLGALVTLVHLLATHSHIAPSQFDSTPELLLAETLDVVKDGLAHSRHQLAADEALFWLWWCVEQQLESERLLSDQMLFDLIDLLTPLASSSPDPQTRFLAFRLVARLVSTAGADTIDGEAIQASVLKQLVTDCPSASLRAASVGLVKEVLLEKLRLPLSSPSIFLDGSFFLSPLGRSLLCSGSHDLDLNTVDVADFLEHTRAGVTERLSLLFVILKRDRHNRTGIITPSVLSDLWSCLLQPLTVQLDNWLSPAGGVIGHKKTLESEVKLELELVRELLYRVEEAWKGASAGTPAAELGGAHGTSARLLK